MDLLLKNATPRPNQCFASLPTPAGSGKPPLVVAMLKQQREIFWWLIADNRNVHICRPVLQSALDIACLSVDELGTWYIHNLIWAGADVMSTTNTGETTMHLLCRAPQ